jgi:aspartate aminotransferase
MAQVAAEIALNGDQSCMIPMITAFKERNQFLTDGLNSISGIRCLLSEGAFYAFADVREAISNLQSKQLLSDSSDITFCAYLLEKAGVAVVPGSAFGSEGYIRLSFATSMENLREAIKRIGNVLN